MGTRWSVAVGIALLLITIIAGPSSALPILGSWSIVDQGFSPVASPPPNGGASADTNLRYVTWADGMIWYEDRSSPLDKRIELRWAKDTDTGSDYDFDDTFGDVTTSDLTNWGLHADVFSTDNGLGMYYWDYWVEDDLYFATHGGGDPGQGWGGATLVGFSSGPIDSAGIIDIARTSEGTRLYFTAREAASRLGVYVATSDSGSFTSFGPIMQAISSAAILDDEENAIGWTPTGAVRQTSWGAWIMALVDDSDSGIYLAESQDGLTGWQLVNSGAPILFGDSGDHDALMELDLIQRGPNTWDVLYDALPDGYTEGTATELGLATLTVGPVPEPASLALLACAIGGIGAILRRRRRG